MKISLRILANLILLSLSSCVSAASDEVSAIIQQVRAPSYDCPDNTLFPKLEATLAREDLTSRQRFALKVAKGQYLICRGDYGTALSQLEALIAQQDLDKQSYAYISAINQIGFIHDVQEQSTRCQYYQQAHDLSSPAHHSDIFMTSSLALYTYCSEGDDVGERLGKMFSILERYSKSGTPGELAHIHNAIGLIYGSLGQLGLAAEQYLKAHEIGSQVYEGSNRLSSLISVIVSLLGSGQTDEAYQRIEEFERLNRQVNTPLTNYHYYYSLSYFYRKTRNYEQLEQSLPAFEEAVSALANPFGILIYKWHKAEVCLYQNDLNCLSNYLSGFDNKENTIPPPLSTNLDYLSFNLAMYLALGDIDKARKANEIYSLAAERKFIRQQDSARILSAANLYNRIYDLESAVIQVEKKRKHTLVALLITVLLSSIIAAFVLRRKFLATKAVDPVTRILNAEIAVSRINKLKAPDNGRVIGIAIFDVNNLREVTRQFGSSKADSVLRNVARTLQNNIRGNDILGRFGTEQFIMCLHNVEEYSARPFFEKLQTALNHALEEDIKTGRIKVSAEMSIFIAHEKMSGLSDILDEMVMSLSMNNHRDHDG